MRTRGIWIEVVLDDRVSRLVSSVTSTSWASRSIVVGISFLRPAVPRSSLRSNKTDKKAVRCLPRGDRIQAISYEHRVGSAN